jgi:tripartite-type tricarboxylate transporter receptor subunit TctC
MDFSHRLVPPAPVVTRLTAAMKQVMDRPDFRERLNKTDNDPVGTTPEEFRQVI